MIKINSIILDGKMYSLGFKVVTQDLESLGLHKNPNIIQYPINDWYSLAPNQIIKSQDDFGGIWVTRALSSAKSLKKYMQNQYSQETRIFRTALGEILYYNNYRIKTDKINMFEEIYQ